MSKQIDKLIIIVVILINLTGIILCGYLGTFNRFYADDWCYNADFRQLGFMETIRGYFYITHYASNRFSLTLSSGLSYLMDVTGAQILTPLTVVFWLMGMGWVFYNLNKITQIPYATTISYLAASVLTYYTWYLTPHPYQSLYWRSGLLTYTAPLVMSTWIFGMVTHQIVREKPSTTTTIFIAPISFIAGGFSEAGCSFLTAGLAIYLIFTIIGKRKGLPWAQKSFPASFTAFIFVLLAMMVLVISPANEERMSFSYGEPQQFDRFISLVFLYAYDFIKESFKGLPIPYAVLIFTFVMFGYLFSTPGKPKYHPSHLLPTILTILGVGFLLVAASYAPSAYIEGFPPATRAQIIPRFVMNTTTAVSSWAIGSAIRKKYPSNLLNAVMVVILLSFCIYTIRSITIISQKIPIYAQRAEIWDERDLQIKQAKENGILEIDVRGVDGAPVGGIRDLKPNGNFWINQCAAIYYGMDAIRATLP